MNSAVVKKATKKLQQSKVAATNTWLIYSWAFPVYVVQLILVLVGLAFLGIGAGIDAARNDDSLAGTAADIALTVGSAAVSVVDYIAGTNLAAFGDPTSYFFATTMLAFVIGMITLMAIGLIYQITFTRCLFGDGSALKISALIVAMFGYFTPVLNLLPWFLAWTLAVWLYPR